MGKAISFAVVIALITKMFDIFQAKKDKTDIKQPAPNLVPAQTAQAKMSGIYSLKAKTYREAGLTNL